MYCYEAGKSGEERTYILDNSDSVITKGEPMNYGFTTQKGVRIGKTGDPSSLELTASYAQGSYDQQQLEFSYSMRNLNYYKDFYLEYQLVNTTNNNQTTDNETIMGWLGYTNKKNETYSYYDGTDWKITRCDVYYTDDTSISHESRYGSKMEERIRFEDIADSLAKLDELKAGTYRLTVRAKDKRTGDDVPYLTQSLDVEAAGSGFPSCTFIVPNKSDPIYTVSASNLVVDEKGQLQITVRVQDPGYRLGSMDADGVTKKMGTYKVHIIDETTNNKELSGSEFNVSPPVADGIYEKDKAYRFVVLNPTQDHQYRVEIWGVNMNDETTGDVKLYDSNNDSALKSNLLYAGSTAVQLGTLVGSYNPTTQILTVNSVGGVNLEGITSVFMTVTQIEDDHLAAVSGTMDCQFVSSDKRSAMTVSLADLLEGLNPREGDFLEISMLFAENGVNVASGTVTISYSAPPDDGI